MNVDFECAKCRKPLEHDSTHLCQGNTKVVFRPCVYCAEREYMGGMRGRSEPQLSASPAQDEAEAIDLKDRVEILKDECQHIATERNMWKARAEKAEGECNDAQVGVAAAEIKSVLMRLAELADEYALLNKSRVHR